MITNTKYIVTLEATPKTPYHYYFLRDTLEAMVKLFGKNIKLFNKDREVITSLVDLK